MPEMKKFTVYKKEKSSGHYDQLLFYTRAFEIEEGYQIRITQETTFSKNEIVVAHRKVLNQIKQKYQIQEINKWKEGLVFQVLE